MNRTQAPITIGRREPGELVHVDVSRLNRSVSTAEYAYVAVDDATRLTYVQIRADRDEETMAAFRTRAVAAFASCGIPVQRTVVRQAR